MLSPKELCDRLVSNNISEREQIRGCTKKEISEIEKHIGKKLPKQYTIFLETIGRCAGMFMIDVEIFYPKMITLTDRIKKLVGTSLKLPEDSFVFASRYGEQFLYFEIDSNPNPPIYRWSNDEPKSVKKVFKSIWDFVEEELESHEQLY